MEIRTIKQDTTTVEQNEIAGKIIRKASIANQLLDKGHRIIHLKADKMDPDHKKSVYVFEVTPEFEKDLDEIMKRRRQEREESFEERVQREVEARLAEKLREISEE